MLMQKELLKIVRHHEFPDSVKKHFRIRAQRKGVDLFFLDSKTIKFNKSNLMFRTCHTVLIS